jgi:hypothetical protein
MDSFFMTMYQVKHEKVPCRSCGQTVYEDDRVCPYCAAGAPGITSSCPSCASADYVYHVYGYHYVRGVACAVLLLFTPLTQVFFLGPALGLALGFVGRGATECVCKECGQGWLPHNNAAISRFNFFVDRNQTKTRRFKNTPSNCY